jgi:NADPH:quinone reductase-like Zn-dependent oxidoreductase
MKAARFHEHGGPEVFRYEDAPDPVPPPGWALVRVRACALNHLDIWQRRGLERVTIPMPHISGADVAGDVAGGDTSAVALGTRVMLQPGLSCGHCARCLSGQDHRCASYDVLGYQSSGGYADLVTAPIANLMPIPDHIDFVTAAAFPLTFLTAWHMLVTLASLSEADTVLILAAGSGVGQAAVQVAKAFRARVIATAGGHANLERARALGADEVVDHYQQNIAAEVKRLTGGRGADIVIEHVGIATWEASLKSLARGGRLVTCGATTGYASRLDLRHLFARQLSIIGSYMGGKPELIRAAEWFFRGLFTPVVDRTFPLAEAGAAHRHLESSGRFGKVVLIS